MGKVVRRRWETEATSGIPRRDRRACDYEAYIPDSLIGRAFTLEGSVAADVADAEAAIIRLNSEVSALSDTEAIARLLLRAESVASSRIEGLEVGARRLLKAEAARELGSPSQDVTADEVLGNIDAMVLAVQAAEVEPSITVDTLFGIHRRLLAGTRHEEHGGCVREVQNWIGGSDYNPCSAVFVPPPPESVPGLLEDLAAFCNDDSLSPVTHAAIAHAQFETIHPFVDGNGRTGRALIHLILRRRGLAVRVVPPVSLVLATVARDYVGALTGFRYAGSPTSEAANEGVNRWVELFATSCVRSVEDADDFEGRVRQLQRRWREQVGRVRAKSSADLLLSALPGSPVLTVSSAAKVLGRSVRAANTAIAQLVDAGVLRQINVGRRNRAFEAPDVIEAFTDLERRLASPASDTRVSPPARSVPRRR